MKEIFVILITLAIGLTGCQRNPESAAAEHDEAGEGAVFKAGHGLSFSEETKKAIGLDFAEAETRNIAPSVPLTAQVYRTSDEPSRDGSFEKLGNAYASALIAPEIGRELKAGDSVNISGGKGRITRVDTTQEAGLGKIEVLLEIPDPEGKLRVGTFLSAEASLDKQEGVAIPTSAVLETADGLYTYVQNGEYLLRTPVTTGLSDGQWIEITDGLYEGDVVAAKPVSSLYLIELRATKGGGHCH